VNARSVIDAAVIVIVGFGAFFFLVGTVGLLRLPDFYSRTHAATKCDTLGAGSVLVALALIQGFHVDSFKIVLLAVLVLLSSPTAGHALARAAFRAGLEPWRAGREEGGEKP
jgi:monovalent cation/proton antiporter MnhG/PhaG subunit